MITGAGKHFPKIPLQVEICDHRYDAICAVSHNTDEARVEYKYPSEMYLWRRNIKATIFDSPVANVQAETLEAEKAGKVRYELYSQTERWWKDGQYAFIPDWGNSAWTSAGAAVFANAVAGQPKTQYWPNHGQDLYDISNGVYGYDFVNDQIGSNNLAELFGRVDYESDFFNTLLNRRVSCLSYRNGRSQGSELLIGRFLAGRNSGTGGESHFGESHQGGFLGTPGQAISLPAWISRPSTFRWWSSTQGGTNGSDAMSVQVAAAKANKGFMNMFMHWNDPYYAGTIEKTDEMLTEMNTAIGSDFCWRCTYGEAVEYAFFRECVKRVGAFVDGSDVVIVLEKEDPFSGTVNTIPQRVNYDGMNTPLSLKIDLTGTPLAGQSIVSNGVGLRSLGSNVFVVDIDIANKKNGVLSVRLEQGTADYYDFTLPSITSATNVGNASVDVVTNVPTTCVVFKAARGASDTTVVLHGRSNTLGTSHSFEVSTADLQGDLYIGICSREGMSILSTPYQFL